MIFLQTENQEKREASMPRTDPPKSVWADVVSAEETNPVLTEPDLDIYNMTP